MCYRTYGKRFLPSKKEVQIELTCSFIPLICLGVTLKLL